MSATVVIAAWGALSGTTAAFVSIANFLRDRPKLRVSASSGFLWSNDDDDDDEDKDEAEDDDGFWLSTVHLEVVNIGRQPVAVMDVLLRAAKDEAGGGWATWDDDRFTDDDEFPIVVRAGEALMVTGLRVRPEDAFAAVTDARGNEIVVPVPAMMEPPEERVRRGSASRPDAPGSGAS
jgi:hypothetical protein